MKKFFLSLCVFATVFSAAFLTGCKSENPLYSHVSELRLNLYEGQSENYQIKAQYGYREHPYKNDASAGQPIYTLTFKLIGKETDQITYTVGLSYGGEQYRSDFSLDPVKHSITATIEITDFDADSFEISISSASQTETVILKSIVPDGTIDYKTALDYLYQSQSALIGSFTDANGNINLEIYERLIVKNGKPYWYIGLASGNDCLKALLVDGSTGELLAVREIF